MKYSLCHKSCVAALSLFYTSSATSLPTVTIDAGILAGTTTLLPTATGSVNQFLGIPFAQSPPERFSPPTKPKKWSMPLNVTAWKPACIQQFNYPEASRNFTLEVFNNPPPEESEDCLYLNVYAPFSKPPPEGRTVMFWIYGGSLQFGNAGQSTYDGSAFAAYQDVVVVTVNYRTNVFGFANSPELPLTGQNLGFLDQRAGLNWVQRNIRAFGGDPAKVTIFGESAGGFSVDALLTSYPKDSKPPFRAAILQSGQISYRPSPYTGSVASWNALAAALNCGTQSNLTCIRNAPATQIKSIIERAALAFSPIPDNVTLVSNPAERRTSGNIAKIPTLSGTTAQEGRVFQVAVRNLTTFLQQYFSQTPELIPQLIEAYPDGGVGLTTPYDIASQIFTEYYFQCPEALYAQATADSGIPAWHYYFNASFPNTQGFPNAGVYHASEIPIVFGTYPQDNVTTTQEFALSSFMQGAWAKFAKNPAGGPGWNGVGTGEDYGVEGENLGVLGDVADVKGGGVTVVREGLVDERCRLFEGLYNGGSA
ncbi:carboxylesterase hlo [Tothia fuscella]|uniref:Carboxylic ester hydrolase n=1 Tax=Tothia fuscella TaxID=1048955 RepID=A0A9P4P1X7_9PEZI|nr:carboxylesterase hlo [Tothia fuscella]